ncbi:MAG: glycoside hydrolase family 30 beta sandwich domain-containing protein [Ferruginibacter sp.]
MHKFRKSLIVLPLASLFMFGECSKKSDTGGTTNTGGGTGGGGGSTPPTVTNDVDMWLTRADQSALLQKQSITLGFSATANASYPVISVDSAQTYQSIDGFGYTLTGGSAYLINHMDAASRASLLNEMFGSSSGSVGVSYLRISMGASDLSSSVFSYDDMPAGMTDVNLTNFSLSLDTTDLIPVLKEILAINPSVKLLASPWSAPVWMKDNGSSTGGSLQPAYYSSYGNYFVKYIQQMQAKGIPIYAVTVQNEPQHGGNNPSMVWSAAQEADFVKNHLGPKFQAAGISTKIIVWDHNCDNPGFPMAILSDAAAKAYVDGSAFHLYAGDVSALSTVHDAYPDKNVYFTEQWTGASGSFEGDFKWHIRNVIIGTMTNWSKTALEWNLASDPAYSIHTPGGCTECKGAVTISGSSFVKNVGYYIIAQVARFVPAGSVRIASSVVGGLPNVAFKTPSGKKVLLVMNEGTGTLGFNIGYKGRYVNTTLPVGGVATFIW